MIKCKNGTERVNQLSERLLDFAAAIIKLTNKLPKNYIGKHIAIQLMRSGTSSGSNYEEARGAESRADFIHKLGITLKELKESRFWLRLIQRTDLIGSEDAASITQECNELAAIIAKSVITAKENK